MFARLRIVLTRLGVLFLVVLPLACENSSPTSPSARTTMPGAGGAKFSATDVSAAAAADGSTLKVSAPVRVQGKPGQGGQDDVM